MNSQAYLLIDTYISLAGVSFWVFNFETNTLILVLMTFVYNSESANLCGKPQYLIPSDVILTIMKI